VVSTGAVSVTTACVIGFVALQPDMTIESASAAGGKSSFAPCIFPSCFGRRNKGASL
jgi:hypothetical protein